MFGQVVIGLPQSGKSTYCAKMKTYLAENGRNVIVINLDPACEDNLAYECSIDIRDLICTSKFSEFHEIGPNFAIVESINYLVKEIEWLKSKLRALPRNSYLLFDMPGQTELYCTERCVKQLLQSLTDRTDLDLRLVTVFMANSTICQHVASYMSISSSAFISMMQLALPQVNVLSMSRLVDKKKLLMTKMAYENMRHLSTMVELKSQEEPTTGTSRRQRKYDDFLASHAEFLDSQIWLSFVFFDIKDGKKYAKLTKLVDDMGGYYCTKLQQATENPSDLTSKLTDKDCDDIVKNYF